MHIFDAKFGESVSLECGPSLGMRAPSGSGRGMRWDMHACLGLGGWSGERGNADTHKLQQRDITAWGSTHKAQPGSQHGQARGGSLLDPE